MTIAVIDPGGVAPDHPELTASLTDKTAKMVANANFTVYPPVIQTVADLGDDHGTQCAGSAAAAFDDQRGIAGAAPNCHLIGARIHATPTAVEMADAFLWAAGFGNSGAGLPLPNPPADVISASFGNDGVTLSDTIRDCFEFLTTSGRGGRGCFICFSIGNTGYLNFTDPAGVRFRAWATSAKTIAVGASINVNPTNPVATSYYPVPGGPSTDIPTQVDRRTFYSPFGSAMLEKPDFVAPSHTAYDKNGVMFDPIMSCVRVGTGDINGCAGPQCNDYRASFGGTSHACPVVAGVAALVISARPDLTWMQVRDVLRQTATRVDIGTTNPTGKWKDLDGDGVAEFSRWYGYGRIDADTAVAVALGL